MIIIFLKLLQKNVNVSEGREKAYLMRAAANICKDHLRSAAVKKNVPFEEYLSCEEGVLTQEESELLHAMAMLPLKYRSVIHLHYYEGYTLKEISKILKLSVSAVSMRLTRSRKMLNEFQDFSFAMLPTKPDTGTVLLSGFRHWPGFSFAEVF